MESGNGRGAFSLSVKERQNWSLVWDIFSCRHVQSVPVPVQRESGLFSEGHDFCCVYVQ